MNDSIIQNNIDSISISKLPAPVDQFVINSISFSKLAEPIDQIRDNTNPLQLFGNNLDWFSFAIALTALIAGIAAAIYSWKCYKFQKISVDKLDQLVPGQMSFYCIAGNLLSTIEDIESVFFGKRNYKDYPLKLIFSMSVLPDDFIELQKYEKKKNCYDAAVELKMAWRNYNTFVSSFIESALNSNYDDVLKYASFMIDYSKKQIVLIQKVEKILIEGSYLTEPSASNEQLAYYYQDLFFEYIQIIRKLEIEELDISRRNLTHNTINQYTKSDYLPVKLDFYSYLSHNHYNRRSAVEDNPSNYTDLDIKNVYKQIKNGEFDFLNSYYHNISISDIDPSSFKEAFYNYMEPIIVGYKRWEFSKFASLNQ